MPQANADQEGIAAGLKNRVQQSAAIAEMRDEEEHPRSAPTPSPYASTPQDKVAHQRPAPKGEKATYQQAQDILNNSLKKYHKGVASVPETGPAILKKGEKVVPAEKNPDNPDNKGEHMGDKDSYHHNDFSATEKSEFHRSMSSLHKGGLHRALGIAEGEKIPMAKIEAAAHSDNGHLKKMAVMAKSMKAWKHGK
jgi:hypothetical protein